MSSSSLFASLWRKIDPCCTDDDVSSRILSGHLASTSRPGFILASPLEASSSSPPRREMDRQHDGLVSEEDTTGLMSISAATQADDAVEKVIQRDPATSAKLLTAGALAGAISKTATAPLARITILSQVQGSSLAATGAGGATSVRSLGVAEALRTIIRREGFTALWKGNGVTLVHRLPYSASNFYIYEQCRKFLRSRRTGPGLTTASTLDADVGLLRNMSERLISGAVAGSCAVTIAYPLDLVRTRLAVQGEHRYYKGILHALQTIVRDDGVMGLYRGLGATVLGTGPNIALNYCLYESFKSLACRMGSSSGGDANKPSVLVSLACGSLSGVCSTTVTFPLDLVRRRIQMGGFAPSVNNHTLPASAALQLSPCAPVPSVASLVASAPSSQPIKLTHVSRMSFTSMVSCIYKTEGLRGFYHGIRPEYLKVVPGVAIAFGTYEALKRLLAVDASSSL